jgi:hypothetical protein
MVFRLGEAGRNLSLASVLAKEGAESGDGVDDARWLRRDTSRRSPGGPTKLWRIVVRL